MFEKLYAEANSHGLYYSAVTLTMLLLESACLTDSQESWILQTVAGDYSRYNEVRRALRRLPGLDSRHGSDAKNWPVLNNNDQTPQQAEQQQHEQYQEPPMSLDPNVQWHYPVNDEDEKGSTETDTDDYCSSASDLSDNTYMLLQQSFAIHSRRRHFNKRKGKGKPRRKRPWSQKGKGYHPIDNRRNYSEEVPQGWTKEKWMARTPCEGCGSR